MPISIGDGQSEVRCKYIALIYQSDRTPGRTSLRLVVQLGSLEE